MFGKTSWKELQTRIQNVEAQCAAFEKKEEELQVLRDDYEKKIKALEEQRLALEAEKKAFDEACEKEKRALTEMLSADAQKARDAMKRSLEEERVRAVNLLNDRIGSMQECYVFFLSQIKLMMDMVTKAATNTTELFFTEEKVDIFEQFCKEMDGELGTGLLTKDDYYSHDPKSMISTKLEDSKAEEQNNVTLV